MASRRFIRIVFCALWLAVVTGGLAVMLNYQKAAGRTGPTPVQWPASAEIPLEQDRPTLLMFAHPRCPCSRASMGELNRLLARCNGRVVAHVLFLEPSGFPADWTRTGLWQSAAAIPGVKVHADRAGEQARRFGAETSGFVVLYNADGELQFKGGITAARGHAGDNAGANLIVSLLGGGNSGVSRTPVYGCELFSGCETSGDGKSVCTKPVQE